MATRKIPMTMEDWEKRLNLFLRVADREVLKHAGKVTAEIAKQHAEKPNLKSIALSKTACLKATLTALSSLSKAQSKFGR